MDIVKEVSNKSLNLVIGVGRSYGFKFEFSKLLRVKMEWNVWSLIRDGQGFWFYGISGYLILGIRYFNAKYWVMLTNLGYKVDQFFFKFWYFTWILDYFWLYWMFLFRYIGHSTNPPGRPWLMSTTLSRAWERKYFDSITHLINYSIMILQINN